jgi:hypothetical protein
MVSFIRQERPSSKSSCMMIVFRNLLELASVQFKVKIEIDRNNLPGKWVAQRGIRSIVAFEKRFLEGFNFFAGGIHKLSTDLKNKRCVEKRCSDIVSGIRSVDDPRRDIVTGGLRRQCRWQRWKWRYGRTRGKRAGTCGQGWMHGRTS